MTRHIDCTHSWLNNPEQFIEQLGSALCSPLPGVNAQLKMASPNRLLAPPKNAVPRQSAVLLLLYTTPQGLMLILTRRALTLKHHKGQICFPGGRVDKTDHTFVDTALRETEEDICTREKAHRSGEAKGTD